MLPRSIRELQVEVQQCPLASGAGEEEEEETRRGRRRWRKEKCPKTI